MNENEYTLAVHCWIINSKKEILITQRNLNLNRGGMWEDTHGGVKSGESIFTDFSQTIFSYIDINNLKKETNYEY